MSGRHIRTALLLALLALLIFWIAKNTRWTEVDVPMPLRGEAARNPFYAAQRFSKLLGASTEWHRTLGTLPPSNGVLVVSSWHWTLISNRRLKLERWVASGGRLVVDRSLIGGEDEFARWSGISRLYPHEEDDDESDEEIPFEKCVTLQPVGYELCDPDRSSTLISSRKPAWVLRDLAGIQVLRVNVGRGSVTAINADPFQYRAFLEGDHAALFAAATQLRRGDAIHFLSEREHPTILALLWRYGAPVVALALGLIALALWRGSVRFGPLAAAPEMARRSLGEQILGTGRFIMRLSGGAALHAAAVRALGEAARRRISAYERMSGEERIETLAKLTQHSAEALASAINSSGRRRTAEWRSAIALIEETRRRILIPKKTSRHDNGIQHDYASG